MDSKTEVTAFFEIKIGFYFVSIPTAKEDEHETFFDLGGGFTLIL